MPSSAVGTLRSPLMLVGLRPAASLAVALFVAAAALAMLELRPALAESPSAAPAPLTLTVRADRAEGNCYAFWRVGNYNQPHLFADPNYLRRVRDMNPFTQVANVHYFLGGRWQGPRERFLGVDAGGKLKTDFTGMIAELKGMLSVGLTPQIVLDNVPFQMTNPPRMNFYGNTGPPDDKRVWRQYVKEALEAMIASFGRKTVASWRFTVGTEPDLYPAHWAGTKEEWLAHYDYTVDAFTSVLPEGEIGTGNIMNPAYVYWVPGAAAGGEDVATAPASGPRTRPAGRGAWSATAPAGPRGPRRYWGLDVIDHCAEGNNAATGGKGTRMDSIAFSWYARIAGPIRNFDDAVDAIRGRLARYPKLVNVPIDINEHAVLGDEFGGRLYAGETTEWSAGFYAFLADRVYARGVRTVIEWDHATDGVLHPKGHVISMLERMVDGQRLAVDPPADPNGPAPCGAVACRKDGKLFILLYHHRAERAAGPDRAVRLLVADPALRAGQTWRLSEWAIDANRTTWGYAFYADAQAAGLERRRRVGLYEGSPTEAFGPEGEKVFRANREKYLRISRLPQTRRDEPVPAGDGRLALEMTLPGHSVRFLELTPGK